ncbi:pentatricopeptide repeat-containing protein At3g58590 [Phalaenopsis equestris]|uniref:pentatricopeptide repeat-containing protein At3g58590 n=1 Tax=Phalaenopsis equestris TaxID=78828 RepID=UPI0009E464AF|nr:pentatricopeptide repeat-containing protein At3g58590 [Phalaenopsis equestris]
MYFLSRILHFKNQQVIRAVHPGAKKILAVHYCTSQPRLHHPLQSLYTDALNLLSSSPSPEAIKSLHALSITYGPAAPISVHHSLITAYAIEDDIVSARRVFDQMLQRNSVSYNSIISALCRSGEADKALAMLSRMRAGGFSPSRFTFAPILSSSSSHLQLSQAIQLHTLILKSGLLHPDFLSTTALLNVLGRNGKLDSAVKLFNEMPEPTVLTWNCIIIAFSRQGLDLDSMCWFRELMRAGIGLTDCSFLSILKAFRSHKSSELAEQIHGLTIKTFFGSSMLVSNALLNAYCNCFPLIVVDNFFSLLPAKDLITWNTFITAKANSDRPDRIMELFFSLSSEGFSPNEITFTGMLCAFTKTGSGKHGELIHAKSIKHNLNSGAYVGTSLVEFYAKHHRLDDAFMAFTDISDKNVVSWNALISGYTNEDPFASCLLLVKEMLATELRPNESTFSSALKSASVSDLAQIHSFIIRAGYENDDYVSSSVISSYASHGHFSDALACAASLTPFHVASLNTIACIYNRRNQFEEAKDLILQQKFPDNISCNILLTSHAYNRNYSEAFQFFRKKQASGFVIDNYTVVSLVTICSRISAIDLGRSLHGLIFKVDAGSGEVFVQNVLLDMYAKCGCLESSVAVFDEMLDRNLVSWTALVSGLGLHGRTIEALEKFRLMEEEGFVPDSVAFISILSACRHGGFVEEGMTIFNRMRWVYEVEPEMDHYVGVVDLLCSFGRIKEAEVVISGMPLKPNEIIWRVFLHGCKKYCFASL